MLLLIYMLGLLDFILLIKWKVSDSLIAIKFMLHSWVGSISAYYYASHVSYLLCSGRDFIAPCKCKGTSKYVHRECLDHWRAVKVWVWYLFFWFYIWYLVYSCYTVYLGQLYFCSSLVTWFWTYSILVDMTRCF